jgi:hypothetical protein
LRRALSEGWQELRVETECLTESGFGSLIVGGDGVGIWNEEKQFNLEEDKIKAQLRIFQEVAFARMRESYGGKNDPGNQPPRLTCKVSLSIDGVSKEVRQFNGGRQSKELKHLADRLFEICRVPAESGVGAADLNHALDKIANGELASETLHILVQRRINHKVSSEEETGWLLRVDGRRVSARLHTPAAGYTEPLVLELGPVDIASLAKLLRDLGVGDLPPNMYAEYYTDMTVEVLNHRKNIQARQFAGLTPTTHGEKQDHFNETLRELRELHQYVLREVERRKTPPLPE